jgi:hypothetical protein
MRYPRFFSILLPAIGLAACAPSTDEYADTADDAEAQDEVRQDEAPQDEAPQDEAALIRQAAIEAGIPMSDVEVPVISDRTYTAGSIQVKVSGHFDIDASPALDTRASISSGGYTWIQYGTSGSEAPNATVTIGAGDMGISVAVGRYVATGTSTECSMTTTVTDTKVSGHFVCPKVTGYNQADRSMGDLTIEVDFEASS